MGSQLKRWLRTFHTIRHLQPRQAWYFFLRRGIGARRVAPSTGILRHRQINLDPVLQLEHAESDFSAYTFTFLNRTLSFPRETMNWCPDEAQRLWRYNLHYFDFLREPDRSLQQKIALLDDWIASNPQGSEPAWEPYTASLRIVNWCRFFWSLPKEQVRIEWLQSLHLQARWLERNLELHILANHYFENIKAMLFAAIFFDDRDSARWLQHFQKELITQLREQTLADGGHYERSPQYHCILLEDYLDLHALLRANSALINSETLSALETSLNGGLRFLALITTPDDDIPLFNDSASGTASRPSHLFAKARQLGFAIEMFESALIHLPDSGLFGWKCGMDYFLIDCGNIGPAYQPGHTHCDFLSYVLMIDGQWLVVDSGVCEYEPGSMRQYVRSTRAHNTVVIDGEEQSEIWGEFRVGRRAQRIEASLHREGDKITFEGAYRGFPALKANITHRRRVALMLEASGKIQTVEVNDIVDGNAARAFHIETLLHLHPALDCIPSGDTVVTIKSRSAEKNIASIENASMPPSTQSWYCPEFGLSMANQVLRNTIDTSLPAMLSYRIVIEPHYADGLSG